MLPCAPRASERDQWSHVTRTPFMHVILRRRAAFNVKRGARPGSDSVACEMFVIIRGFDCTRWMFAVCFEC